jgi:hypothetical protein
MTHPPAVQAFIDQLHAAFTDHATKALDAAMAEDHHTLTRDERYAAELGIQLGIAAVTQTIAVNGWEITPKEATR